MSRFGLLGERRAREEISHSHLTGGKSAGEVSENRDSTFFLLEIPYQSVDFGHGPGLGVGSLEIDVEG